MAFVRTEACVCVYVSSSMRIKIEYHFSRSIQLIDPSRAATRIHGARMGLGRWLIRKICTIRTRYFSPDYEEHYVVVVDRTYVCIENMHRGRDTRVRLAAAFARCHATAHQYGLFRLLESRTHVYTRHHTCNAKRTINTRIIDDDINICII